MEDDTAKLIEQWKAGDERAADEIFQRYVARLIALARSRLSSKLARRVDAEDVVQSAWRSFFRQARDDRYVVERVGDLWRLLAAITLNKLHGQIEHHTAQKRAISREEPVADPLRAMPPEVITREPSPVEALTVVEELERTMSRLDPLQRQILELRLQGQSLEEIATAVERSERTVRRVLEKVKDELETRLYGKNG